MKKSFFFAAAVAALAVSFNASAQSDLRNCATNEAGLEVLKAEATLKFPRLKPRVDVAAREAA